MVFVFKLFISHKSSTVLSSDGTMVYLYLANSLLLSITILNMGKITDMIQSYRGAYLDWIHNYGFDLDISSNFTRKFMGGKFDI